MNTQLELLATRLEQTETELRARIDIVEIRSRRERRKLRIQSGLAFTAFLAAVFASPGNRTAIAQGAGATLASLDARLSAVEAKTQYMSVDTTAQSTTFSGCNLVVNDGGGSNSNLVANAQGEGVGNIIIGYNSLRGTGDNRVGSHNLVLGDYNNYSSYGGIVSGYYSSISNMDACVIAGIGDQATGMCSFASGGQNNIASGPCASVSGGYTNTASNFAASVSGGRENKAYAAVSSVSGGQNNIANAETASVLGGYQNTAGGYAASILGGSYNNASGAQSSISGGNYNNASGPQSSVGGGFRNTASGSYSAASGGFSMTSSGFVSTVSGGSYSSMNAAYGWQGGYYHTP